MSEYKDFTSMPPDQEQHFVVFEKHSVETGARAKKLALIIASVFGVIVCAIVLSFDAPPSLLADEGKDTGELKEAAPDKPADKPDAKKTDEKPAEGDKASGGGEEAASADGEAKDGDKDAADGDKDADKKDADKKDADKKDADKKDAE